MLVIVVLITGLLKYVTDIFSHFKYILFTRKRWPKFHNSLEDKVQIFFPLIFNYLCGLTPTYPCKHSLYHLFTEALGSLSLTIHILSRASGHSLFSLEYSLLFDQNTLNSLSISLSRTRTSSTSNTKTFLAFWNLQWWNCFNHSSYLNTPGKVVCTSGSLALSCS